MTITPAPTHTPSPPTPNTAPLEQLHHAPHIWPVPDQFWRRTRIRAIDPSIRYVGPMPQTAGQLAAAAVGPPDRIAYVYILTALSRCLYVGKSVNIPGRFADHRRVKVWWPEADRLVLLGILGEDRRDAETAAFYVERLAIRDCKPIHNIAGVF